MDLQVYILPQPPVFRSYRDACVLLNAATQLVCMLLVFDGRLDVLHSVLVGLNKTIFIASHERRVDGKFDVVGSVEPSVAYAIHPVEQLSSKLQLALPYSEGVCFDSIRGDTVLVKQL